MDDWGSPWADNAGSSQPTLPRLVAQAEPERSPSKSKLEAQSIGNTLLGLDRSSLWAGDEGLREWANVESSATPIVDEFPNWSAEVSTRAPLSPNVEENGFNVQGEPKPLWGDELELPVEVEARWGSGSPHNDYVTPATKTARRASVETAPGSHGERVMVTFPKGDEGEGTGDVLQGSWGPIVLPTGRKNDRSTAAADHHVKLPPRGNIGEGDLSSRPSSSPASEKYMEAAVSESPRTSLEEEAALSEELMLRSPLPQRPLVQMTDPVSKDPDAADDREVDFGDFEEETICAEDRVSDLKPHSAGSSEHPRSDQTDSGTTNTRINLEIVAFEVDMALLDQLIPQSHSADLLPDVEGEIISSTSSRKTWHRISRKETIREYNSGNGDYVRVNWSGSSIQANVSKIVARWITEDRIAGGVVLGGGSRLGTMFGWGQDAQNAQRISEKLQVGLRKDPNILSLSNPRDKALSLKMTPRPSPATLQPNEYLAIDTPVEGPISTRASEADPPTPQFGWSTSREGVKDLVPDTPWSTARTHRKAVSMIAMPNSVSPVSSISPLGAMSYPPLQLSPASLDLSGRKTSELSHKRAGSSNMWSPRVAPSAQAAIQVVDPASPGAFSVNGSNQGAAKVEINISKEECTPWVPADLPTSGNRLPTQLKPQPPKELGTLDIRRPNIEAAEEEVVDRVIQGLPNLAYMLR